MLLFTIISTTEHFSYPIDIIVIVISIVITITVAIARYLVSLLLTLAIEECPRPCASLNREGGRFQLPYLNCTENYHVVKIKSEIIN